MQRLSSHRSQKLRLTSQLQRFSLQFDIDDSESSILECLLRPWIGV